MNEYYYANNVRNYSPLAYVLAIPIIIPIILIYLSYVGITALADRGRKVLHKKGHSLESKCEKSEPLFKLEQCHPFYTDAREGSAIMKVIGKYSECANENGPNGNRTHARST